MRYFPFILLLISHVSFASEHPECDSPNNWAAMIAFSHLKNEGLINNTDIDLDKTLVKRIASEEIRKDLYRQVHEVNFHKKIGTQIKVITVNNASQEECSMSSVEIFLVSKGISGK